MYLSQWVWMVLEFTLKTTRSKLDIILKSKLKYLRKIFTNNFEQQVMGLIGLENLRHMIQNTTSGPNGFLFSFLKQVLLTEKKLRLIFVLRAKLFLRMNKSLMANARDALL